MKRPYNTVAKAIRVEYDSKSDTVYLVFQIVDERFKQMVKKDWTQDLELQLLGKDLIENNEND